MMGSKPYRVIAGIGAGAGAALAMLLVMAALSIVLGMPTIPDLMLNTILQMLGGQAFSDALSKTYYSGRPLLFTAILEGTLVLGVLLGLLYAWLARPSRITGRRRRPFSSINGGVLYGLAIGVLLNTLFLMMVGQPMFADQPYGIYAQSVVPLWIGLMVLALTFGIVLHSLLPAVPSETTAALASDASNRLTPSRLTPVEVNPGRRYVLRLLGGTLLAVVGGGLFALGGTWLNQGGSFTSPVDPRSDTASAESDALDVPDDTPTPRSISQALPSRTSIPPTPRPPTNTPQPATSTPLPPATATQEPPPVVVEQPTATQQPPTATFAPPPTDTPVIVAQAPTATPPPTSTAYPIPAIPDIAVKEITPTGSFYHVSKNFFDPSPSSDGWKLNILGLVNNPYSLTYSELTSMPAQTVTIGMMCISNPVGGGLIGNTKWKGVQLAELINRAKPYLIATEIIMRAADDYSDSITLQKALDPNVMLVWEMGGKPLTSSHGFPARLMVPGIYGMKHVKWLNSIELIDYDYKGYWQQPSQGWSDPAPVNILSRIDFPVDGTLKLKPVSISGVAFAGDRSISKVEVSADGGKTWNEAYLKPRLSATSWIVWGYVWVPPKPGTYTLKVRATDGLGNLQTSKRADPYPNGATGYHAVTYRVA